MNLLTNIFTILFDPIFGQTLNKHAFDNMMRVDLVADIINNTSNYLNFLFQIFNELFFDFIFCLHNFIECFEESLPYLEIKWFIFKKFIGSWPESFKKLTRFDNVKRDFTAFFTV